MAHTDAADEVRWQAVVQRDGRADGLFYYGVASTGIYCRPSCPSRRPRRENVRFFDSQEAAEQAGFRPCRRCRPEALSTQQRVVAQVQELLQTAETPPSLAELGTAVGLSPFHLQRLFKRATGLSPREYANHCRLERLKVGLKQGATVTEALYEAGYGSSRALYDQAQTHLGMTPSAYRRGGAGERIAYACAETPLGWVLVAATGRGLCALRFGEAEGALVAELAAEFPRAALVPGASELAPYVEAVKAYLSGGRTSLDLPLDVKATAFQQQVWGALRSIPYGEVRSYREVAAMIGQPAAVRAVARACATNPVALAVPCHRVVRANGDLSGYRWGVERKQRLLERERAVAERPHS
ncbi:MAG: bifunctional DNA-binding transcriptional regulator/O6-methylguanine-DNA methyltransferase Ada [Bacillota bacterium]